MGGKEFKDGNIMAWKVTKNQAPEPLLASLPVIYGPATPARPFPLT